MSGRLGDAVPPIPSKQRRTQKPGQAGGQKATLEGRILRILSVPPPCPHRAPTLAGGLLRRKFSILRKVSVRDCLKYRLGVLTELSPIPLHQEQRRTKAGLLEHWLWVRRYSYFPPMAVSCATLAANRLR